MLRKYAQQVRRSMKSDHAHVPHHPLFAGMLRRVFGTTRGPGTGRCAGHMRREVPQTAAFGTASAAHSGG